MDLLTADDVAALFLRAHALPEKVVVLSKDRLTNVLRNPVQIVDDVDLAQALPASDIHRQLDAWLDDLLVRLPARPIVLKAACDVARDALARRLLLVVRSEPHPEGVLLPCALTLLDPLLLDEERQALRTMGIIERLARRDRELRELVFDQGNAIAKARSTVATARERQITVLRRLLKTKDEDDLTEREIEASLATHEPRSAELRDIRVNLDRYRRRLDDATRALQKAEQARGALQEALAGQDLEHLQALGQSSAPAGVPRPPVGVFLRFRTELVVAPPPRRLPGWLRPVATAGLLASAVYGARVLSTRGMAPPPGGHAAPVEKKVSDLPDEAPLDPSLGMQKNGRVQWAVPLGGQTVQNTIESRHARLMGLFGESTQVMGVWGKDDTGKFQNVGTVSYQPADDYLRVIVEYQRDQRSFRKVYYTRKPTGRPSDDEFGYSSDINLDAMLSDFQVLPTPPQEEMAILPYSPGDPRVVGEDNHPVAGGAFASGGAALATIEDRNKLLASLFRGRRQATGRWNTATRPGVQEQVFGTLEIVHEDESFLVIHVTGITEPNCRNYDYTFHVIKTAEPWKALNGRNSDVRFDQMVLLRFEEVADVGHYRPPAREADERPLVGVGVPSAIATPKVSNLSPTIDAASQRPRLRARTLAFFEKSSERKGRWVDFNKRPCEGVIRLQREEPYLVLRTDGLMGGRPMQDSYRIMWLRTDDPEKVDAKEGYAMTALASWLDTFVDDPKVVPPVLPEPTPQEPIIAFATGAERHARIEEIFHDGDEVRGQWLRGTQHGALLLERGSPMKVYVRREPSGIVPIVTYEVLPPSVDAPRSREEMLFDMILRTFEKK